MTKTERKEITKLLTEGVSEIDCTYRYGYLKSIVKAVKRQVERESFLSGSTPFAQWYQKRLFE